MRHTVPISEVVDKETLERAAEIGRGHVDSLVERIEQARWNSGLSRPVAVAFRTTVIETVRAYASESVQDYTTLLEQQGVIPNPLLSDNPDWAVKSWAMSRALIVNAEFDLDRILIYEPGRERSSLPQSGSIRTVRRDEGRPFLRDLDSHTVVSECVLPGRFIALDGTEFDGSFVLQFTLNPEIDQWVVTELRLYGLPNGSIILLPPL